MNGRPKVYMTHPIGCRHYFNEPAAVSYREPQRLHDTLCGRAGEGDGHQFQRLYYTASRRWAFLCVHPFGSTNTHATYISSKAAQLWLERNGYDAHQALIEAKATLRSARAARRAGDHTP